MKGEVKEKSQIHLESNANDNGLYPEAEAYEKCDMVNVWSQIKIEEIIKKLQYT